VLFEFDEWISKLVKNHDCRYSRYADDITISGPSRASVATLLAEAEGFLEGRYSFHLNKKKSRIASANGRQVVTGAVVNAVIQPPREFRRKVRAIFHDAAKNPRKYSTRVSELNGYLGYLNQFKSPALAAAIESYRETFKAVKEARRGHKR
jgi:retron-type reverse transcriptase